MRQVNDFSKGLVADLDYCRRPTGSWDFPTQGYRIINKDGQGLVLSTIDGTEHAFSLSEGFISMGGCEHNGILYIASYNPSTGLSEVGSYPSPNQITVAGTGTISFDTSLTGFSRTYKPLGNMYDGMLAFLKLSTSELNFGEAWDDHKQIDMFAREDYDGSVNLYITDDTNPVKVINSGFDQDGVMKYGLTPVLAPWGRYYNIGQIDRQTRLIKLTDSIPGITVNSITSGGRLKPGNYYLFIRYSTLSFDKTPFIAESGPVQVFDGNNMVDIEGAIDNGTTFLNKKIALTIDNLDQAYSYFEIGVIRYSGEFSHLTLNDYYLIDKYYVIDGATKDVTIYGTEDKIDLSLADYIKTPPAETICKAHMQSDNRYWGIHWREEQLNKNELADLAQLAQVTYWRKDITDAMRDDYWNFQSFGGPDILGQHKDFQNTLEFTTYFRGEIYPFALVYLLESGLETEAYPIQGLDEYNSAAATTGVNTKGIYRFPFYNGGAYGQNENNMGQVFGVKLNLVAIQAEIAANPDKYSHIKGFYLVRGDRIPNMLYQGFMLKAFNGVTPYQHAGGPGTQGWLRWKSPYNNDDMFFGNSDAVTGELANEGNSKYFPFYRGWMPTDDNISGEHDSGSPSIGRADYIPTQDSLTNTDFLSQGKPKYGIYSPSHLFEISNIVSDNETVYIRKLYTVTSPSGYEHSISDISPETFLFDLGIGLDPTVNVEALTANSYKAKFYNVVGSSYGTVAQFCSKFEDYYNNHQEMAFAWMRRLNVSTLNWEDICNRSIKTCRYIGIELDDPTADLGNNTMVNINRYADPTSYWDASLAGFSPENANYYKISDLIEIDSVPSNVLVYRGDGFLQRTFFRQLRWNLIPTIWDDTKTPEYKHGLVMGFVSENTINTAMRNDVPWETSENSGTYTYYPKSLNRGLSSGDVLQWGALQEGDDYLQEAFYINPGYNVTTSEKFYTGFNAHLPFYPSKKPTRIRYSSVHTPYSYIDGYAIMDIDAYQDYDLSKGEMVGIGEINNRIVTIQHRAINRHFSSERQVQAPTSEGEIIIGTGSILTSQVQVLAEYGSQHQWSIQHGYRGVYGVDWNMRIIWRINEVKSNLGSRYFTVDNLTEDKLVSTWLENLADDNQSDITNQLGDNPIRSSGVLTGFDPRFKEMYFNFAIYDDSVDPELGNINQTLLFSERLDFFLGTVPLQEPGMFFNINNELLGCQKLSGDIHLFNEGDPLVFFGERQDAIFSVVVNGLNEGENTADLVKYYGDIKILTNATSFSELVLQTLYQLETRNPFIDPNKFWLNAEYLDHKWRIPIGKQTSPKANEFEADSRIRGAWMKMSLTYSGEEEVFVKFVDTEFNLSFV